MYVPPLEAGDFAALNVLPADYTEPNWYAVQTGANQEKEVAGRLQEKGVQAFLPLYQEVRRRTDRKVVLQVPLFRGYVFTRIALRDRLNVLMVPRVVRLVGFGSKPAVIPEQDIEALRAGLADRRAMPHPYLQVGRRVRVVVGPFQGIEGVLIRRKSSLRLVISIDAILRSFTVEVDESEVEPIGRACAASR